MIVHYLAIADVVLKKNGPGRTFPWHSQEVIKSLE
jgi:hypothetical protein